MGDRSFPDHFSGHAAQYARYRPDYPEALFDFLAEIAPSDRRAWDCATGNGQAAIPLSRRFREVLATDASARQIEEAPRASNVRYEVAPAESAPADDASVDVVTVAQALHWFALDRFWPEVRRVLVPRGIVAVWCYDLLRISTGIDPVMRRFYRDVVGPYWPPERARVERGYAALAFPFEAVDAPPFSMRKDWALADLLGYVRTWSATQRYQAALEVDPVEALAAELSALWGRPEQVRQIRWDLDLRVGRKASAR